MAVILNSSGTSGSLSNGRALKIYRGCVLSGGAPTPAGISVFAQHNWDMRMGHLSLNGWSIYDLLGWEFMT